MHHREAPYKMDKFNMIILTDWSVRARAKRGPLYGLIIPSTLDYGYSFRVQGAGAGCNKKNNRRLAIFFTEELNS